MDLNTWKPLVAQTMQKLGYWLLKQQDNNPYPVYSTLTGLTLWPLVEQAAQTGQLFPAAGGLYAVSPGDGANIIARQVETWIKQGDQLTEAEVIADTGHLIENSDVRDYLDEMITKLDAMRSVQPFLTTYPQWQQQLVNELKRLGNLSRFQATLTGDGAIAQGEGSTAIGSGGVKAGNVGGSILAIRAEPGATVNIGGDKLPRQVYTAERRVLDAAIAQQIPVGQTTELVAMIRREESGGLLAVLSLQEDSKGKEGVKSETFGLMFPVSADGSLQPAELFLRVVCPDFKPSEQEKRLEIPVIGDSAPVYFLLEAQRVGELKLMLEVLSRDKSLIAQHRLKTNANRELSTDKSIEKVIVSMPIFVLASPASSGDLGTASGLDVITKQLGLIQKLYENEIVDVRTLAKINKVVMEYMAQMLRFTAGQIVGSLNEELVGVLEHTPMPDSEIPSDQARMLADKTEAILKQATALHSFYAGQVFDKAFHTEIGQAGFDTLNFVSHLTVHRLMQYREADVHSAKRRQAETALKQMGMFTLPSLIEALQSENPATRQYALELLAELGDVRAVPYLLRALRDKNTYSQETVSAALARIRLPRYWTDPYGEPEWVEIPAGEFMMGSERGRRDEQPLHTVYLPGYAIARTPITNAQYWLFMRATGHQAPYHWPERQIPEGLDNHPVVGVSWYDAMAYCTWLSQVTGKQITLPSEAEWEKAARGDRDAREYPWGDVFDSLRCNTEELGLETTTPVGIFPDGASPYGVLDMSGNVWEWTQSQYQPYPYRADDGREGVEDSGIRVIRGGSSWNEKDWGRCASRYWLDSHLRYRYYGFRAVVSPFTSGL